MEHTKTNGETNDCWNWNDRSDSKKIWDHIVYAAFFVEGENEEKDWEVVFFRDDEKWEYLTAGCDYTGWR